MFFDEIFRIIRNIQEETPLEVVVVGITGYYGAGKTELSKEFSEYLKDKFQKKYANVIEISKILFNHEFFTISGIKISDLRNEAAHPQKKFNENGGQLPLKSSEILSINNYIKLLKILSVEPNLLKLIIDLKD